MGDIKAPYLLKVAVDIFTEFFLLKMFIYVFWRHGKFYFFIVMR